MTEITFLFELLFEPDEREIIRSKSRKEPYETLRKAFILFAYILDYSEYEIGRCTERNRRQTRYLLNKASDLYSVRDAEITRIIERYEATLERFENTNSGIS